MKPESILKLEREFGVKLDLLISSDITYWENTNKFSLNVNNEVVGLNLYNNQISNIICLNELKQLETLVLSNNEIKDITPLKGLKELKKLNLSENEIIDISPLIELKKLNFLNLDWNYNVDISKLKFISELQKLRITVNSVTDLSVLKELKQLKDLKLIINDEVSISVLKELKQLATLDLIVFDDVDISILSELKQLTSLSFHGNITIDLFNLSNLKRLKTLTLRGVGIIDISKIKELIELTYLDLSENEIIDISVLNELKQLTYLYLSRNQIIDISMLKDLKQLKSLNLSGNQIKDVSKLKDMKQLTILNLSENKISEILIIKELKQLTSLDLSGNKVSDISILKELKQLTELYLGGNKLVDISVLKELKELVTLNLNQNHKMNMSILGDLKQLTTLSLARNKISDISMLKDLMQLTTLNLNENRIDDISLLKELKCLRTLNLSGNKIVEFSVLKDLTQLINLDLSRNQIENIFTLKELKQLRDLSLKENQIIDISALGELNQLVGLSLSENKIVDISNLFLLNKLKYLDLSNNQIINISGLHELKKLFELYLGNNFINDYSHLENFLNNNLIIYNIDLEGNPLPIPTACLYDVDSLRSYFKDKDKGITEKRNIKLLFLGDGCVGKSTLLNHIKTLNPPPKIDINKRTEGIQLDIWKGVLPETKINVWDFGGQEIMHSTHRLFLGEQAIYILVWCKESKKKCSESETHNLKYWLDFIADYGKQSIVLLVENVIENEFDNNEFPDDDALSQLVTDYKQKSIDLITTQYRFDCQNNTDEVDAFRDVIKNKIKSLQKQYPLKNYPSNWYEFQERLEIEKKNNKTISLEYFNSIANDLSISSSQALLDFFSRIGVVGYYQNFSKDKVVLQLEWILDAIYVSVKLKDNPLIRTKGKLLESDFDFIWNDYQPNDKILFKEYMLKSNLLSKPKHPNRFYDYLCPALFDKKSIDSICWEDKKSYVAIKFNFIFGAIMQQLQVRILNYCHFEDEETFYQNYICFKGKNNSVAWVEMIEKEKELRIYCENENIIQTILNEINNIYPLNRTKLIIRKDKIEEEYKFAYKKEDRFDSEIDKKNDLLKMKEEVKEEKPLKVFVTYSWSDEKGKFDKNHQNKVGKFVNQLRTKWRMDASFDLHQTEINFIKMMYSNLYSSDKIIIVLSAGYALKANQFKESGVEVEYTAVINDIKENPSKYILVCFDNRDKSKIPFGFQGNDVIVINEDLPEEGSDLSTEQNRLVSKLTDEPIVEKPKIAGKLPKVNKKSF